DAPAVSGPAPSAARPALPPLSPRGTRRRRERGTAGTAPRRRASGAWAGSRRAHHRTRRSPPAATPREGWPASTLPDAARWREHELVDPVGRQSLPPPTVAAGHADLHVHRARERAQPEVRAEIALGEIAASRSNLAHLPVAAGLQRDARADREAVRAGRCKTEGHPVVARPLPVLEQSGDVVHVAHHDVEVAVVVEIAHGETAAHLLHLQARSRLGRHVAKGRPLIEEELVLLAERLLERGEGV